MLTYICSDILFIYVSVLVMLQEFINCMKKAIKDTKKKKLQSNSKLLFCDTFYKGNILHFLIQEETNEVSIGLVKDDFQTIWRGIVKEKITCLTYCKREEILYAGTKESTIAIISFDKATQKMDEVLGKIDALDGSCLQAIASYYNKQKEVSQLITINSQGVLRRYRNGKQEASLQLPFKISKALANKSIQNIKSDLAMAILRKEGKFPLLLTTQTLIKFLNQKYSSEQMTQYCSKYELLQNQESGKEMPTSQIQLIAISSTKNIIAIAKKQKLYVNTFQKDEENVFKMIPQFGMELSEPIINIDMLEAKVLLSSAQGILACDAFSRVKLGKLSSKSKGFENYMIKWVGESKIIYGSLDKEKSRISIHEFKSKQQ